jgi:hypothetical protein
MSKKSFLFLLITILILNHSVARAKTTARSINIALTGEQREAVNKCQADEGCVLKERHDPAGASVCRAGCHQKTVDSLTEEDYLLQSSYCYANACMNIENQAGRSGPEAESKCRAKCAPAGTYYQCIEREVKKGNLSPVQICEGEVQPSDEPSEYIKIIQRTGLPDEEGKTCIPSEAVHDFTVTYVPKGTDEDRVIGVVGNDGHVEWTGRSWPIEDGDKIITPDNMEATLHLLGTAILHLEPGTTLTVPCSKYQTVDERIILDEGYIVYISKLATGKLAPKIYTKDAIGGVKGTTFTVERRNDTTTYRVVEGVVEVASANKEESVITVSAGEKATINATGTTHDKLAAEDIPDNIKNFIEINDEGRGTSKWVTFLVIATVGTVLLYKFRSLKGQ